MTIACRAWGVVVACGVGALFFSSRPSPGTLPPGLSAAACRRVRGGRTAPCVLQCAQSSRICVTPHCSIAVCEVIPSFPAKHWTLLLLLLRHITPLLVLIDILFWTCFLLELPLLRPFLCLLRPLLLQTLDRLLLSRFSLGPLMPLAPLGSLSARSARSK